MFSVRMKSVPNKHVVKKIKIVLIHFYEIISYLLNVSTQ